MNFPKSLLPVKESRTDPLNLIIAQVSSYDRLSASLKKDSLEGLLNNLNNVLWHRKIYYKRGSNAMVVQLVNRFANTFRVSSFSTDELLSIYRSFTADDGNAYEVASASETIAKVWEILMNYGRVNNRFLEKEAGMEIFAVTSRYHEPIMDAAFYMASCLGSDCYGWERADKVDFYLKPKIRRALIDRFYGPKIYEDRVKGALPRPSELILENFEPSIASDLEYLYIMGLTANPVSPTTGSITAAKLKKIADEMQTKGFRVVDSYSPDRLEMLANIFYLQRGVRDPESSAEHLDSAAGDSDAVQSNDDAKQSKSEEDAKVSERVLSANPKVFARFVVNEAGKLMMGPMFGAFLPKYKGFTRFWTEKNNAAGIAKVLERFLKRADGTWLDLSNLRMRYLCSSAYEWMDEPCVPLFPAESRDKTALKEQGSTSPAVKDHEYFNWFDNIDFPFMLHWLRFLCGAGLVMIAFEKDREGEDPLGLEWMRYARFTPLGRYAFGLSDSYEVPVLLYTDEKEDFEFDDSTGILTLLKAKWPYRPFMKQMSESIGSTRFRITPESLVRGCATRNDFNQRLETMERFLPRKVYPGLNDIIEKATARTGCKGRARSTYTLVCLRPELRELMKEIVATPKVRRHVVLAEGGYLLVEKEFYPKFAAFCSGLGYLLE